MKFLPDQQSSFKNQLLFLDIATLYSRCTYIKKRLGAPFSLPLSIKRDESFRFSFCKGKVEFCQNWYSLKSRAVNQNNAIIV